jgi:plasmid maintenance system killer protein
MDFEFADSDLEEVYYEPSASLGHGPAVDKGFRKTLGFIMAAHNELDLRQFKGLHYHKLSADRDHQHAMDITDKWRLIIERIEEKGRIKLLIISVEDYH